MEMCSLQLLCPSSLSPTRTSSDCWWHWHPNLHAKMSLRKCLTFVPNLHAIQQNSSLHSIHQNSSHRSGFSIVFFTLAFALTLGPWLALFAFAAIRLLACALACIAVSLKMCSVALETPITRTRWPFSFARRERERELTASTSMGSECPREPMSLGLESRILEPNLASTYVTTSRRASSNIRKRVKLRNRCFSSSTTSVSWLSDCAVL